MLLRAAGFDVVLLLDVVLLRAAGFDVVLLRAAGTAHIDDCTDAVRPRANGRSINIRIDVRIVSFGSLRPIRWWLYLPIS